MKVGVFVLCLLSFALAAPAAPANLSPATTSANPVALLNAEQKDYLYAKDFEGRRSIAAGGQKGTLFCYGSPVELTWTGTAGDCTVSVKRLPDNTVVWTGTTSGTSVTVWNLELGAEYEWTVTSGGTSASATFRTEDTAPRLVKTGLVRNLRDLGGWTGTLNGRAYKVRQNLLFRGAAADDPKATDTQPAYLIETDSDRDFFCNVVGLKNEVDLRNLNSTSDVTATAKENGTYKFDLTGERVAYSNFSIANNALPTSGSIVSALRLLTTPAKLPAYFHCKSGRDRTGIMAAVLLAVLGVSRDDIVRDYQTTSDKDNWTTYGFNTILDVTLAKYKDAGLPLAENARAYLLDCGLTSEQVETFRATMLDGYAEETARQAGGSPNVFSVSPYVQHPDTNAMTIVFFTTSNVKATVKVWPASGSEAEATVETTTPEDVSAKLGKNALGNSDTLTYTKQYRHKQRFTGLKLHTDYRYEVTPEGGAAYRNQFRTLPDRNTPVRFIGYCDCETTPNGSATSWSNHASDYGVSGISSYFVKLTEGFASNIVHMISRKPDLITISGDIAAKGGYQMNWDEFWKQNAGANGNGYNDPAGSIPILAAIGNHDLKDASSSVDKTHGGESALEKYLTYFEYNPNGVPYDVSDGTSTKETRDMSQLFHREDLGPVTLIFLDTNKGANGYGHDSTQDGSDRPNMRAPDFHPGSPQYNWLTNQLADAQRNSRFTFVLNHHCPYSVGQHNRSNNGKGGGYLGSYDGESALAVRVLTDTMIRYGVDAWLCGHDEIQEHSQTNGFEVLPDGRKRAHTLNVYDLGSGGDGLRGEEKVKNPLEVFRAYKDEPDVWDRSTKVLQSGGCHYGFMEVDVTTNKLGKWTCSLTPCYDFIYKDSSGKVAGFELRRYKDRLIIDEETNEIVYQEWKGDRTLPENHLEYVRPPEGPGIVPPPPYERVKPYVKATWTNGETNYRRVEE